ncbi:hypothetical protein OS493_040212, partial [Desmophyllum pertusum]
KFKPPKPRFQPFHEDEEMTCKHRSDYLNAKSSQASSHNILRECGEQISLNRRLKILKGFYKELANPKGSSVVVRYQHDINYLRDMARSTVEGYDLLEFLTPVAASFQDDLVRYPEQHDQIVITIKQRRDQCIRELADIENEIMNNNA